MTDSIPQSLGDVLHRCHLQLSDRDKKLFNLRTSPLAVQKKLICLNFTSRYCSCLQFVSICFEGCYPGVRWVTNQHRTWTELPSAGDKIPLPETIVFTSFRPPLTHSGGWGGGQLVFGTDNFGYSKTWHWWIRPPTPLSPMKMWDFWDFTSFGLSPWRNKSWKTHLSPAMDSVIRGPVWTPVCRYTSLFILWCLFEL